MSRPFSESRLRRLLLGPRRESTFWRHDVDVSIDAMVAMAELERDLGVSAIYYLMVDSPFYTAGDAFLSAQFLPAMGHRVGWHLDERTWAPDEWFTGFDGDIRIPVSWHCPTEGVLWRDFHGVESAYHPRWEGKYYSDSRGEFSHGDPEDDARQGRLQINLHPEWWFEPDWADRVDDGTYETFFHEPKSRLVK